MTRKNLFPLIFMIGLSIMPVMFIHMPRALAWLPLLFGLVMSVWWVVGKKEKLEYHPQYLYCITAISILCIMSSLWSIEPIGSYKHAIKVSAILLFSIPLFSLTAAIKRESLSYFSWLFPAGVTIAALLCSYELMFDLPIYRATHSGVEALKSNSSVMNRGVVSTILSYFVAMLFIKNIDHVKIKYAIATIMTISIITMLSLTQSQSGQLAFVLGLIVLVTFPSNFKYSYKILTLAIISAIALTPFIVDALFISLMDNAQEIPWLKDGYAGNRIEIWDFVMRYALNNPLYGYGMEATRFVTEFKHDQIYHKGITILHPHNFSIQIWIEFGIIGVIASSVLIAFIIQKISLLDTTDKRIVLSILMATLAIAAISYGMWQSWWVGQIIFLVTICTLMVKKP